MKGGEKMSFITPLSLAMLLGAGVWGGGCSLVLYIWVFGRRELY